MKFINKIMNKNIFFVLLVAISVHAVTQNTSAANPENTSTEGSTITRDAHYIYISTPVPLTFDKAQQEQIKIGTQVLLEKLEKINANNPRKTVKDKLTAQLIESAKIFETELDGVVDFAQKYYTSKIPNFFQLHKYSALPYGFVLFSGVEATGGTLLSGGGSVMLGLVFVPTKVDVIDIDTEQLVASYITVDSTLVVWPTANVGIGVGGGANARIGTGFIWGKLQKASDFKGLVVGASKTLVMATGINAKAQLLKNWSKPGAFNNAFVTVGLEAGPKVAAELHGNISYMIDAVTFFKSTGSALEIIKNKMGLGGGGGNDGKVTSQP